MSNISPSNSTIIQSSIPNNSNTISTAVSTATTGESTVQSTPESMEYINYNSDGVVLQSPKSPKQYQPTDTLQLIYRFCRSFVSIYTASSLMNGEYSDDELLSAVQPLIGLINKLQPGDLGLSIPTISLCTHQNPPLPLGSIFHINSYLPAEPAVIIQSPFSNSDIRLVYFILPKYARIPLHDHPGMLVLSKVLYGKLQIISLNWANQSISQSVLHADRSDSLSGNAVVTDIEIVTATDPVAILYPHTRNLHEIIALEDSCMFDIMMPSYLYPTNDSERSIQRYRHWYRLLNDNTNNVIDSINREFELKGCAETPSWFHPIRLPYSGPQIILDQDDIQTL